MASARYGRLSSRQLVNVGANRRKLHAVSARLGDIKAVKYAVSARPGAAAETPRDLNLLAKQRVLARG
jgi:hypothetical protein